MRIALVVHLRNGRPVDSRAAELVGVNAVVLT
jgi:hypothetical protein